MVNPDLLCRPRACKGPIPLAQSLPVAIIALGLLVGSGVSLAGKSEADVTPAPLDMSIVQGFAKGVGATKKAATAPAQSAVEAKTEAPMESTPAAPGKRGGASVAEAPQGQSSTPPEVSAGGLATPAAKPKSSATPTTLDRSIIQGFANDTMQPAGAASAATPAGSAGAPGPVPASTPAEARAPSKAPLPDDQMNLIRQTFSGDG